MLSCPFWWQAQCFVEAERQRLLAIIESAYGEFEPFNVLCRMVLRRHPSFRKLAPTTTSKRVVDKQNGMSRSHPPVAPKRMNSWKGSADVEVGSAAADPPSAAAGGGGGGARAVSFVEVVDVE